MDPSLSQGFPRRLSIRRALKPTELLRAGGTGARRAATRMPKVVVDGLGNKDDSPKMEGTNPGVLV
jgi:hypothetical protein